MNNLIKNVKGYPKVVSFIFVSFLLLTSTIQAQDDSYENGKKYILGGITVTGATSYNEQTVKTYTGLRVGQEITVPGEAISDVINKLIKLELFSDVSFYVTNIVGKEIFLELNIKERPSIAKVTVYGVRKGKVKEIVKEAELVKGKKITESFVSNTKNYLENKYKKKGFLNTKVTIATSPVKNDSVATNEVEMVVNIHKGKKVKIKEISIVGNEKMKSKQLRGAMKNTKRKFFGRLWKKSKFIEEDYKADLVSLVDHYAANGYRDARIVTDTVKAVNGKNIAINLNVIEGDKYYFGDINFIGNTVYTDRHLRQVLGIKKGDTYNGVKLKERIEDKTKPDADDLTNQYQNNGYLFSNINPVEVSAANDTINMEIRIVEGKETFFNRVTVSGNDKTNDHVIYRTLRTRPGQKYRKADIVRTVRELSQLGYFDAESIGTNFLNPDPNTGTLDFEYTVQEKGSSQIELQGGYGGGGFIGTVGLSFSNFSIKNILKGEAYKPVPMGDGQTFSLRLQASRTFRTYSLSFSEPWLGGRKPVRLSVSLSHTQQFLYDYQNREVDKDRKFSITGISVGLAKNLAWPDDYFVMSHALSFQNYDLKNYNTGLFTFGNGTSNALAYTAALTRKSSGPNPIFPQQGSEFSISAKLTLPYSLFNGVDYEAMRQEREQAYLDQSKQAPTNSSPQVLDDYANARAEAGNTVAELDQEFYKWLEYYKIKFSGTWYNKIIGKLTLKTGAEFAFLGAYNLDRGVVPFERFYVGGDGLGNYTMDGRENVQLRGYENQSITPYDEKGDRIGATIYNKFSMELRYPLTLKPSASIYGLAFMEAGNAYNNFSEFNPFNLKRSAGVGLRIFMPAFGLLGIDFGYGFDNPIPGTNLEPHGWETHFIIGQQF